MQPYRHTQRAELTTWAAGLVIALSGWLLVAASIGTVPIAILPALAIPLVLLLVLVLFGSMTVEVTPERLAFWFGPGWIRKEYPLREIAGAEAVRNRWYYGWGIRWTPHGWLYNVHGLGAVEVRLASGRKLRIGSDEPRELESAIRRAIGAGG